MSYKLDVLKEKDRKRVMEIFNYYIVHDFSAYFEDTLPDVFFDRLLKIVKGYPAYVAKDAKGKVVGFAFLHAYHQAPSFKETGEITYFIHPDHTNKGLGTMLLKTLIEQAHHLNMKNILASISSKNENSIAFHKKHGFQEVGRLPRVGSKFGEEFDVVYMLLKL